MMTTSAAFDLSVRPFRPSGAGFAAARQASAQLDALAGRAARNADTILRSPADPGAAPAAAGGAAAWLASDEGRAALEGGLRRGLAWVKNWLNQPEQLRLPLVS